MRRIDLSDEEAVSLLFVSLMGTTALDSKSPLVANQLRRFEQKFNITITQEKIRTAIQKLKALVVTGDEEVTIS